MNKRLKVFVMSACERGGGERYYARKSGLMRSQDFDTSAPLAVLFLSTRFLAAWSLVTKKDKVIMIGDLGTF
jgi:hypothetical protein